GDVSAPLSRHASAFQIRLLRTGGVRIPMGWIVAAIQDDSAAELPHEAEADFKEVAKANPAAPWKLETGHLRAGRELLEEMTGRSWEEVDLTPEEVREVYENLSNDERAGARHGLAAAIVGFLEVCARHGFRLEGGSGARRMRR